VEQVGEHPDAALLDLRRLRILGVIDEVAMQVLGDDPLRLGLPSRISSSPISRIASTARMPCSGRALSGEGSSRNRLP
jgi:hypothetical protein